MAQFDATGIAKPELTAHMGELLTEHGIDHILRALAAACRAEGVAAIDRNPGLPAYACSVQDMCERNAKRLDACNWGDLKTFAETL